MPTKRQIEEAFEAAKDLCPGVRIKGVGPDGVAFDYPEKSATPDSWDGKPFCGSDQ